MHPEGGFAIDKIMQLYINFQKLALTQGGCYTELAEWTAIKKVVINLKNNDERYFKLEVITVLHPEETENNPKHISKLQHMKINATDKDLSFH